MQRHCRNVRARGAQGCALTNMASQVRHTGPAAVQLGRPRWHHVGCRAAPHMQRGRICKTSYQDGRGDLEPNSTRRERRVLGRTGHHAQSTCSLDLSWKQRPELLACSTPQPLRWAGDAQIELRCASSTAPHKLPGFRGHRQRNDKSTRANTGDITAGRVA